MSNKKKKEDSKKISILLLGDSNVGKTSIFKKFFKNEFKGNYTSTIGVEFLTKEFQYKNKNYSIQFFDTAGQERFRSLTESYYHLGEGFFIVFDLTNKNSLLSIEDWINNVDEKNPNNKKIILGNKDDLEERQIPEEEINDVLDKFSDIQFIRVSAKEGTNIEKAFETMIELFENYNNENKEESIIIENKKQKGNESENKNKKEKNRCC